MVGDDWWLVWCELVKERAAAAARLRLSTCTECYSCSCSPASLVFLQADTISFTPPLPADKQRAIDMLAYVRPHSVL